MKCFFKRLMDIFISTFLLIVFFPIFVVIGIAIKVDSKGPVFYTHERVGKNKKKFKCYKFRSMHVGSDPNKLSETSSDSRITKVGKFLRNTSLDEVPQLINVFLSDMSIVGPRPALPSQVEKFSQKDFDKLLVKPGLTGWTQINGRNLISYEKRMELDCWYANNWSIFLDILILLKTPFVIFSQEGIYGTK